MRRRWLPLLSALAVASCGTPTSAPPGVAHPDTPLSAAVLFRYVSPVPKGMPPNDPVNWTGCVHHWAPLAGPGPTLAGSWSQSLYRPTAGSEDGVLIVVRDVPANVLHVVGIWDLALCNVNASADPVSFKTIHANGVLLTRVITLPSGQTGAALTLAPDGTVTP